MTMKRSLPDVAKETSAENFPHLDWVGMDAIELPILLKQADGIYRIPALVEAKVNLDLASSRGIHMSRLYMIAQEQLSKEPLTLLEMGKASAQFLETHKDLSSQARLSVRFDAPLKRKALKSENEAWRNYPVKLSVVNDKGTPQYFVEITVTYSSTCPASAALSRQLIQDAFKAQFNGGSVEFDQVHSWLGTTQGIVATPHSQRSFARVKVEVVPEFEFITLIDAIEEALQTAVQGAVKREDEQEFALRNGQNLMFCEDAARRAKKHLDALAGVRDYVAEFSHIESLHPHNAVSRVSKGLKLRDF